MFKIENGLLMKDGKPVFAIGESYYPSFHEAKYPVPPEGDRLGEMKKDFREMAEFGVNHVRIAGLHRFEPKGDGWILSSPFADQLTQEAQKAGLSVSVRLQGYSENLRGHENVLMINRKGEEQDVKIWFDFIRTSLHHPGMREDNRIATRLLAAHFAEKGAVGLQIYNEPHYPGSDFFDYHPAAVRAWRDRLVKTGRLTPEEAESAEPPRSRREKGPKAWAEWRLFCRDSLTEFLTDSADASRAAAPLPTYTCLTTCETTSTAAFRGADSFGCAKGQDIAGYTTYRTAEGMDYFSFCLAADLAVSAAALEGKQAWCVELDSRTSIPPRIFNQNTLATAGAGVKGIVFYQWRGDHPSPATPIPNGCGVKNYDGSKTPNYENAKAAVALLHTLSDDLVNASPRRDGAGILVSDYAIYYADAAEHDEESRKETLSNSALTDLFTVYRDLKRRDLNPVLTDAEHLDRAKIRVLIVPKRAFLSEEEEAAVRAWEEKGGALYEYAPQEVSSRGQGLPGYRRYGEKLPLYRQMMQIEDLCALENLVPLASCENYGLRLQSLETENAVLLTAVNVTCPNRPVAPRIDLHFPAEKAVLYRVGMPEEEIRAENGALTLPEIADGCVLRFAKKGNGYE